MKAAAIFLLLLSSLFAFGQADEAVWEYGLLERSSWPKPVDFPENFRFSATIRLVTDKVKAGKTMVEREIAEAVWLRNESWLADSLVRNSAAYAQLLFDCYEYEARRVSGFINAEETDPQVTVDQAINRARKLNTDIFNYTAGGSDRDRFMEMRLWMDSLLQHTARYDIPQFERTNVSVSADVGGSFSTYTGNVAACFDPLAGFSYGVKLKIRRLNADLYQTRGTTSPRQELNLEDFKFGPDDRISVRQNSLAFGYDIFRKGRFSLSPHGALSSFRVINKSQPKGSLYNRGPASYFIGAGFSASYFSNAFFQDDHLQYCWYIVFRAQYDLINYLYTVDGSSLRFQLGAGVSFHTIRNVLQD